MPPRLPPRSPSESHLSPQVAYLTSGNHPYSDSNGINDPRSSSEQSLLPVESPDGDKRKLLLVYIHGFLGAEASFKSFPAHVHSLLAISLVETHVIHTKIYPRYRSRKNISFARDNFSNWLYPHESHNTDIVLLGHSLGGILSAEVVLIPNHTPGSHDLLQHRILGQVAFDTPFLGMHPGVVTTGIASLFRSAPEQPSSDTNTGQSEILNASASDPNYNPSYSNDVQLPVRKNPWDRAWYFWNKHAGSVTKAARSYVLSHFEFGGCLADYPGLRKRYEAIRSLEDVDELQCKQGPQGKVMKRVRFVNYYTASTGRLKPSQPSQEGQLIVQTEMQNVKAKSSESLQVPKSGTNTPRISLEEYRESDILEKTSELKLDDSPRADEAVADAKSLTQVENINSFQPESNQDSDDDDAFQQTDKETRKREKQRQHEELKRWATLNVEDYDKHMRSEGQPNTKKKDRKFCSLPAKDSTTGMRDSTWIRVYMEGMDEVVAHTSLFNVSETYAKLVGDTAERITEWVHDDATTRALLRETAVEP